MGKKQLKKILPRRGPDYELFGEILPCRDPTTSFLEKFCHAETQLRAFWRNFSCRDPTTSFLEKFFTKRPNYELFSNFFMPRPNYELFSNFFTKRPNYELFGEILHAETRL
jgi:hypothetical protein